MRVRIHKGIARGDVAAPPSKSMAHRLLMAAAMCEGESLIDGISDCDDVIATEECLTALGASVKHDGSRVRVVGIDPLKARASAPLDCHESGSTARFIIPPAMLSGHELTLVGRGRLMSRPMSVYEEIFSQKDLFFQHGADCINLRGPLLSGEYDIPGDVSSQFISGLIFALPLASGDSIIKIIPPFESRPYVDMTLDAVRKFGISVFWQDRYTLKIPGGQRYTPTDSTVEGDFSGAAFIDALNLFGGEVRLLGLNPDSYQADKVYGEHFRELTRGACEINLSDSPDLAPILFTIAAAKFGARFTGTARLRIKESDRCEAMATELKKFGASVTVLENEVIISPAKLYKPSEPICAHNDHRIVMALAVLLTQFGGEIVGAEAVKKSYPDFFRDLRALGIGVDEYDV
ncbi:MAG: 3-phosphoshikimate 1-carboxyvinyltransferase [Clostridia bacterium]|nr:3-phosphoshikimate 1-carboxyvinyltransferase [Clostridia bacterium]